MRWITFDCYGTLVDWRHGISTAASLVAPGRGADLLAAYNRHEPEIQRADPGLRYRDVLAEGLRLACSDLGVPLSGDDASVLAVSLPYWPVFPEVGAELGELRSAGWRLALLTNCDRDLVGQTLRRLPVRFDAVVTAEDSGAYKPSTAHFSLFRESFEPSRWVHVAQSYTHDLVPARDLGLPRV
ncbi:MAG: HAD-IA family hydrolase, partial [Nonomuraea sp.]|nr:HAD-IA family hydrolase [Nonomuraea sp.]